MKKIYNTPAMLCVELRTANMMATSEYTKSGVNSISRGTDGDEIEVKGASDVNVWDKEW